jgi:hypothetical protein
MQQRPTDDALYRTAYRDVESQMPLPPGYIAEADGKTPKLPLEIYSGKQIASYDYRRTPEALREQRVRICQTVTGIHSQPSHSAGNRETAQEEKAEAANAMTQANWDDWLAMGQDRRSLLADPKFVKAAARDDLPQTVLRKTMTRAAKAMRP